MGLIRIDYSEAIREGNRLISVAADCESCNAMIDKLINLVPTYWQGEAANAFINELNQWKRETNSIRSEASRLGSDIKRVAQEIREAEERILAAMRAAASGK